MNNLTDDKTPTLIEERLERAPRNLYGGRVLEKNGKGFIRRIRILTCDSCGLRIGTDDPLRACTGKCQSKICEMCTVIYDGRIFCRQCLKSKLRIDGSDLDVLNLLIAVKRDSIPKISSQLEASSQSVRKSVSRLLNANLIQRRSVSIFTQFEPTALAVYNQQSIAKLFDTTQNYQRSQD